MSAIFNLSGSLNAQCGGLLILSVWLRLLPRAQNGGRLLFTARELILYDQIFNNTENIVADSKAQ